MDASTEGEIFREILPGRLVAKPIPAMRMADAESFPAITANVLDKVGPLVAI